MRLLTPKKKFVIFFAKCLDKKKKVCYIYFIKIKEINFMFDCPWVYVVIFRYDDNHCHLSSTCFESYEEASLFAEDRFQFSLRITGYTVQLLRFEEVKR